MNPQQVWQAVLADLHQAMSTPMFETWVKNTVAIGHEGTTFTIGAPNTFAKEWLDTRFRRQIEATLSRIVSRPTTIAVAVEGVGRGADAVAARPARRGAPGPTALQSPLIDAPPATAAPIDAPQARRRRASGAVAPVEPPPSTPDVALEAAPRGTEQPAPRPAARGRGDQTAPSPRRQRGGAAPRLQRDSADAGGPAEPAPSARAREAGATRSVGARYPGGEMPPLDERWNFDTFIVGPSNRFAFAAARAVAESPATTYNPLFIHGGVGLGKTHLLRAIAHEAARRGGEVLYVTCEQFTNDLIEAIQRRQTDEFRAAYRGKDVLLIDDIQFLAGKEATQEEFFHTFNHLHGAHRQIVISSDRPPRAIATLEQRLTSRFEWGLTVDVQPPDIETRTAILRTRAASVQPPVPDDVIATLAQRVQRNVRELEGSLTTVVAYARLNGLPLTAATAARALSETTSGRPRAVQPAEVLAAVARHYAVEPKLLRGKQRDREIVVPRQVAMYLMREETTVSLLEIGRELGGRDHSTVLHGWEKVKHDVESDDALRRDVLTIKERLFAEVFER